MIRYSMVLWLVTNTLLANAQNGIVSLLHAIDSNNTTLQAYRKEVDVVKISNLTGLTPNNPYVQVNHLQVTPQPNRNRTDFSITQSIDFPTAYRHRNTIAHGRNEQAEYNYKQMRIAVHFETAQRYIQWVYRYRLAAALEERMQQAKDIAQAYQSAFDQGDINILERNKARVNLINSAKAYELNEVEREALHAELIRYNGGKPLPRLSIEYPASVLPADFEQWYGTVISNNMDLVALDKEIDISQVQQRLNRALSLPNITAGYMSEQDIDAEFRGITMGLTIPLWQQKNTVKQAKLQTVALQQAQVDANLQFYNGQKMLYNKAAMLRDMVTELTEIATDSSSAELLKKALDLGELTLIEYLLELAMYYETIDRLLESERDYHLTVMELMKWEL